jgi:2-dehydropantoate 2-reductase
MIFPAKKFLVIGAGAIGGFYGAKLAQAGAEVSLVCRSDYEVVKKNGIAIKSVFGDFHFTPKNVLRDVCDYKDEADFILVATKVLPEISVVDLIAPALKQKTSIVLLQNGIHIEEPIKNSFPNHHLISVLAFVCVSRNAAGMILHQDYGRLVVGDYPSGISQKTSELIELWKKSGVPCEAIENIQLERWRKLVWNAAFNPMSVLSGGANTKEILNNKAAQNLAQNVMKEICILAKADGCELPENVIEKNIEMTQKMQPYKTSMLLDFEAKRKMEVEAILGNAIRFAEIKNIEVPHLLSLYGLLSCY